MSNRYFRESKLQSMEKDVKQICANVTFGASGAPTLVAANSKGVRSITRVSAGVYDIIMGTPASTQAATSDVYKKMLIVKHVFTNATAPASPGMYISSNTVSTNGTMRIVFNSAGTSTDPGNGEAVNLQFVFGDSNT